MTRPATTIATKLAEKWGPLLEIACVLALFYGPLVASIVSSVIWPAGDRRNDAVLAAASPRSVAEFDARTFTSLVYTLRLIPVLLLAARGPGGLRARLGLARPRPAVDLGVGIAAWLLVAVAGALLEQLAGRNAWWTLLPAPISPATAILVGCECAATGFLEEVGMRAYLINRIEGLGHSRWTAITVTAVAFGIAHSNKGLEAAAGSVIAGAVWGVAFCATRRVWPVAFSHALLDFIVKTHLAALVR